MSFRNIAIKLSALLFLSFSALPAVAEKITIAVASNFTAAMADIVAQFEQGTGHVVEVSYGSSGKIYAQIINGAPFQIFLSADQAKPQALEKAGVTVPGTRFTYAIGTLTLWSTNPDLIDEKASVLRQGRFNKLALANPTLAPYGVAALEVLRQLKLEEVTRPKWVQGENIAQTFQFVATGNADIGFIALSQIMNHGEITRGSAWIVPDELHEPIRQDAVLLRRGGNSKAARDFLEFMRGETVAGIVASYGYKVDQ